MPRILIAEDEPHIIRVTRIGLERAGFDVDQAYDGKQALHLIRQAHPDALITDIAMPCMDGRELCLRIDREFPERRFPILVLTSKADVEYRRWSESVSGLTFLEKPASIRQLISLLHAQLNPAQQVQQEIKHVSAAGY